MSLLLKVSTRGILATLRHVTSTVISPETETKKFGFGINSLI